MLASVLALATSGDSLTSATRTEEVGIVHHLYLNRLLPFGEKGGGGHFSV